MGNCNRPEWETVIDLRRKQNDTEKRDSVLCKVVTVRETVLLLSVDPCITYTC